MSFYAFVKSDMVRFNGEISFHGQKVVRIKSTTSILLVPVNYSNPIFDFQKHGREKEL
jgi:hypothetical protein